MTGIQLFWTSSQEYRAKDEADKVVQDWYVYTRMSMNVMIYRCDASTEHD